MVGGRLGGGGIELPPFNPGEEIFWGGELKIFEVCLGEKLLLHPTMFEQSCYKIGTSAPYGSMKTSPIYFLQDY